MRQSMLLRDQNYLQGGFLHSPLGACSVLSGPQNIIENMFIFYHSFNLGGYVLHLHLHLQTIEQKNEDTSGLPVPVDDVCGDWARIYPLILHVCAGRFLRIEENHAYYAFLVIFICYNIIIMYHILYCIYYNVSYTILYIFLQI